MGGIWIKTYSDVYFQEINEVKKERASLHPWRMDTKGVLKRKGGLKKKVSLNKKERASLHPWRMDTKRVLKKKDV